LRKPQKWCSSALVPTYIFLSIFYLKVIFQFNSTSIFLSFLLIYLPIPKNCDQCLRDVNLELQGQVAVAAFLLFQAEKKIEIVAVWSLYLVFCWAISMFSFFYFLAARFISIRVTATHTQKQEINQVWLLVKSQRCCCPVTATNICLLTANGSHLVIARNRWIRGYGRYRGGSPASSSLFASFALRSRFKSKRIEWK